MDNSKIYVAHNGWIKTSEAKTTYISCETLRSSHNLSKLEWVISADDFYPSDYDSRVEVIHLFPDGSAINM